MILPRSTSIIVEWTFILASFAALVYAIVTIAQPTKRRLVTLAFVLIAWTLAFSFVRVRTGLGILVLHGADHWVANAAETPDDGEATKILGTVLASSHYGIDAAKAAVGRRSNPVERARLFRLLAAADAVFRLQLHRSEGIRP